MPLSLSTCQEIFEKRFLRSDGTPKGVLDVFKTPFQCFRCMFYVILHSHSIMIYSGGTRELIWWWRDEDIYVSHPPEPRHWRLFGGLNILLFGFDRIYVLRCSSTRELSENRHQAINPSSWSFHFIVSLFQQFPAWGSLIDLAFNDGGQESWGREKRRFGRFSPNGDTKTNGSTGWAEWCDFGGPL